MYSDARTRRHRNPQTHDEQKNNQSFFSKSNDNPFEKVNNKHFFQKKELVDGHANDKFEKQTDHVADKVVNKSDDKPDVQPKEIIGIQRMPIAKEEEKKGKTDAPVYDKESGYKEAVSKNDWVRAAYFLNGFNKDDIRYFLLRLNTEQRKKLHDGAVNNALVGVNSQLALMTSNVGK